MLKRDIEQRDEVFCGRRRRIAHLGDDRSDFEEKLYLALAQRRQVGAFGSRLVDRYCQLMVFILELCPLLVKHGDRKMRAFGHDASSSTGFRAILLTKRHRRLSFLSPHVRRRLSKRRQIRVRGHHFERRSRGRETCQSTGGHGQSSGVLSPLGGGERRGGIALVGGRTSDVDSQIRWAHHGAGGET